MRMEWTQAGETEQKQSGKRPWAKPLCVPVIPAAPAEQVVAVETVLLAAGDVPRGVLRSFYERVVGLRPAASPEETIDGAEMDLRFKHRKRELLLSRQRKEPGRVRLLVRNLSDAMARLKTRGVGYEVLHSDAGMMRTLVVRDPAGNWIELHETRPL